MNRAFLKDQRGDTIIEVVIATVIMGIILFSAYGLSNQSVKLGAVARERSQASQLAQEQAEGLRALRDSANSWTEFRDYILSRSGNGIQTFHVQESTVNGQWEAVLGDWDPFSRHPELPQNLYTVSIGFASPFNSSSDHLKTIIEVNWARFGAAGTSPGENSTIYYNLTDRNVSF